MRYRVILLVHAPLLSVLVRRRFATQKQNNSVNFTHAFPPPPRRSATPYKTIMMQYMPAVQGPASEKKSTTCSTCARYGKVSPSAGGAPCKGEGFYKCDGAKSSYSTTFVGLETKLRGALGELGVVCARWQNEAAEYTYEELLALESSPDPAASASASASAYSGIKKRTILAVIAREVRQETTQVEDAVQVLLQRAVQVIAESKAYGAIGDCGRLLRAPFLVSRPSLTAHSTEREVQDVIDGSVDITFANVQALLQRWSVPPISPYPVRLPPPTTPAARTRTVHLTTCPPLL